MKIIKTNSATKEIVYIPWLVVKDGVAIELMVSRCYQNREDESRMGATMEGTTGFVDSIIGKTNWDALYGTDLDREPVSIHNLGDSTYRIGSDKFDGKYNSVFSVYKNTELIGDIDFSNCFSEEEKRNLVDKEFGNDWTSVKHKDLPADSTCEMIKNGDTLSYTVK